MPSLARTFRLAGLALGLVSASALPAQTIDFLRDNGGFAASTIVGNNPWTWTSGQQWRVNGVDTPAQSRLLSPVFTATGGAISFSLTHRFQFETDGNSTGGPRCYDGGVL